LRWLTRGRASGVTAVQDIIGTSFKIEFVIPGGLAAGNYYVSVSGANEASEAFSSTKCSELQVVAGASPTLTITENSATDWIINNGVFTIDTGCNPELQSQFDGPSRVADPDLVSVALD
jgi:hypothetical protein